MAISRRQFVHLLAGSGAFAAATQLGRSASLAQSNSFRAMVGIFLFGGNDSWNMVVPTDGSYSAYAAGRGATLALPKSSLVPLTGVAYGLHPSFAPLKQVWADGALNAVLNAGSLFQPLTKATYQSTPSIRPLNLMSHADEQNHWQGVRMRDVNTDGFMGRLTDRAPATPTAPSLMSLAGAQMALIGNSTSPLILPSNGSIVRAGYNSAAADAPTVSRQAAIGAFSDASAYGTITDLTAQTISSSYAQAVTANGILTSTTSTVDQYFKNPTTGAALTSDVSRQLLRVARLIEARGALGHARQTFFVSQGGYDTHSNQVNADIVSGTQANLFSDLAMAMAAFYAATKALGVANAVTTFTMSDFGRTYRVNDQRGTDHAWGGNHLVMGAALKPHTVHGAYPDPTLGGSSDIDGAGLGRWIPGVSIEQYLGAVAQWQGVSTADLPYVFPNWSTWSSGAQAPLSLFS